MKITRRIAEQITLRDDATDTGGIAFVGETLYDFIKSAGLRLGYGIKQYNKSLVDCGIRPVTNEEVKQAIKKSTDEQR